MTEKSEAKETYKNDRVKVVVHRKSGCVIEYEVHAEKEICVEARKKASKSVGKDVVVPGFRKGKAPIDIVEKRYPQELDRRWQEEVANVAYRESAALAKVPLVRPDSTVSFKMISHTAEGAHLTLQFETIPVIPSIDPANCVLTESSVPELTKEKIQETIRQTQMFFAKWSPVEGRPVQAGDFLLLDVNVVETDPPESLFRNTRFEVSDQSMAKWMQELVIGKNRGDTVEGVSVPDEALSDEEKENYPPKKVEVRINAIEAMELPPLDDSFAQKLGVKTVEEFQQRIESILTKKMKEGLRESKREEVTEFLLSHYFDLPQTVIQKEVEFRLKQMLESPRFKQTWDESSQQKKRELLESYREQSEKAVRLFYLCRKIAADQNISISPKDAVSAQSEPLEALLFPSAQAHDPRQPDVKQAEAYSRVLLEKTEDWVISHARIGTAKTSKKAPEADKGETEAAPKKGAAPKKAAAKKATTTEGAAPKKKAAAPKKKAVEE